MRKNGLRSVEKVWKINRKFPFNFFCSAREEEFLSRFFTLAALSGSRMLSLAIARRERERRGGKKLFGTGGSNELL